MSLQDIKSNKSDGYTHGPDIWVAILTRPVNLAATIRWVLRRVEVLRLLESFEDLRFARRDFSFARRDLASAEN